MARRKMVMRGRPKVVLLGMLTKMPVGGVAWLVAQYALGFERLGFDVYYIEAHARTPSMFVSDEPGDNGSDSAAEYLAHLMARLGLADRWSFHALHDDGRFIGLSQTKVEGLYREAALIINMHGGTVPLAEHAASRRLIYLGTDPVETEIEVVEAKRRTLEFLDAHVAWFTWGLNHGNPDCLVPWDNRYPFVPSPPPVVLDLWANGHDPSGAPFTTIGNWRQAWRNIRYLGETYTWSKHHEFLKMLDLPSAVGAPLELALSSYEPEDKRMLEAHGWRVRHGLDVSADFDAYRNYLIASRGELSVAKDQNVRFRSGWFSERSATYLAAGRPVVVQDTGFGNALPVGEGLLSFTDLETAADAVAKVLADEARHRQAAREIARAHLSHDVVLRSLLEHVGLTTPIGPRKRPPSPGRESTRPSGSGNPAPAMLPGDLDLEPVARRPLELAPQTMKMMRSRPVPSVPAPGHGAAPTASVIVLVVDNLEATRITLESVLANTDDVAYELIVVDNGSSAPTAQYLSVLAARNPHVRMVVNATNLGFAAGANQGLALAAGDCLVLLNNDTLVPPDWLSNLAAHLEDPHIGLLTPTTNRCGNEAEVPTCYRTVSELLEHAFAARQNGAPILDLPVAVMFCAAMRRDVLEAVGPLDERFGLGMFEDDDYSRRVRNAGYRVACSPDVFVHHFGEASLGWIAAAGRYGDLFEENRRKFEEKWAVTWEPHERRPDSDYTAMRDRVRSLVETTVPQGSMIVVVSHGDDEFLSLGDRSARHLSAAADGGYKGHHPADDSDAIAELETARAGGAKYLVVPAASSWWLDHYRGLAEHLREHYRSVAALQGTAEIFDLQARRP